MKTLYLDCFCGISGDMTVAALIDAGASLDAITEAVQHMSLEGISVRTERVSQKGIEATRFHVEVNPDVHQPHRHLPDIVRIIEAAPLPAAVKEKAIATFQLLGEAEAEVHGMPLERVHFHEVGAADSIVDIVAANLALHQLGVEQVLSSPLTVGSGSVKCDHGVMPVPAPATALLLRGIPWQSGDIPMELTTPTGAALARQWASDFGPIPPITTSRIGYGAGSRNLPDRANVLRVFLGETPPRDPALETVCVLETVIDDMNPELTALLIPATLQAGAKDAFITPVLAKKGRAAHCLTVLCEPAQAAVIMDVVFMHSGTLGIRMREEKRRILERTMRIVNTPWGAIPVKVGLLNEKDHCVAPEFESCRQLAEQHGVAPRRVYESALAAALEGAFIHE